MNVARVCFVYLTSFHQIPYVIFMYINNCKNVNLGPAVPTSIFFHFTKDFFTEVSHSLDSNGSSLFLSNITYFLFYWLNSSKYFVFQQGRVRFKECIPVNKLLTLPKNLPTGTNHFSLMHTNIWVLDY